MVVRFDYHTPPYYVRPMRRILVVLLVSLAVAACGGKKKEEQGSGTGSAVKTVETPPLPASCPAGNVVQTWGGARRLSWPDCA